MVVCWKILLATFVVTVFQGCLTKDNYYPNDRENICGQNTIKRQLRSLQNILPEAALQRNLKKNEIAVPNVDHWPLDFLDSTAFQNNGASVNSDEYRQQESSNSAQDFFSNAASHTEEYFSECIMKLMVNFTRLYPSCGPEILTRDGNTFTSSHQWSNPQIYVVITDIRPGTIVRLQSVPPNKTIYRRVRQSLDTCSVISVAREDLIALDFLNSHRMKVVVGNGINSIVIEVAQIDKTDGNCTK